MTHKIDRNDARGLAQLARTGFFTSVHVKSLSAHAVRAMLCGAGGSVDGGVPPKQLKERWPSPNA